MQFEAAKSSHVRFHLHRWRAMVFSVTCILLFSACGGSGAPAAGTATRPAVTPSQPTATPTSSLLSHPVVYVALGASDAVGVGVSNPATQKTEMRLQIERWKAGIAALASQYDVTLVDLYGHNSQLTAHPEYVSADGFHPSAAGYAQLANYFWQAIKQ